MNPTQRLKSLMPQVTDALRKVQLAGSHLMNDYPYFGSAVAQLEPVEDASIKTLATNGTVLKFNPDFVNAQTDATLMFCGAHEAGHCLAGHPWRLEGKDIKLANIAGDHVLNIALIDAGLQPPVDLDGTPFPIHADRRFAGMSSEKVYAVLKHERDQQEAASQAPQDAQPEPEEDEDEAAPDSGEDEPQTDEEDAQEDEDGQPEDEPGDEDGEPEDSEEETEDGEPGEDDGDQETDEDGDGDEPGDGTEDSDEDGEDEETPITGTFEAAPEPEDGEPEDGQPKVKTFEDWAVTGDQLKEIAERIGTLPGGMARLIEEERAARVDWRREMQEFMEQVQPSDYSWTRMNRLYLPHDVYLPGMQLENLPPVTFIIDTSASMTDSFLTQASGEARQVQTVLRPDVLTAIYVDTQVNGVDQWEPDGEPVTLRNLGGGGTYLTPAFQYAAGEFHPDYIEDAPRITEKPAALVVFTDLYTETLPDLGVPTLFIVPEWSTAPDPAFGRTVRVPAEEW